MTDRANLDDEKKWRYERLARTTVAGFRKRGMVAEYFSTRQEALSRVLEMIPEDATVGWGDSLTLDEVGVFSALKKRKQKAIFDAFVEHGDGRSAQSGEERLEIMRKAMLADFFLSGVNAVTMDGKLVSTDATGNRVAPVIFGPRKVIIVAGANKIVRSIDEAYRRIREIAAPLNATRHARRHNPLFADLPCVKQGTCADCFHEQRICKYTVIIEGERNGPGLTDYVPRIHVLMVGEELGI